MGDKVTSVKAASRERWPLEHTKETGLTSPGGRVIGANIGKMRTLFQPYPGRAGKELPLYVGCCFFLARAGDLPAGAEELMVSEESSPPSSLSEATGWPNSSTK